LTIIKLFCWISFWIWLFW